MPKKKADPDMQENTAPEEATDALSEQTELFRLNPMTRNQCCWMRQTMRCWLPLPSKSRF